MKEEKITYAAAKAEIERIVKMIESDELDVDQLTKHVKRASELREFCKKQLTETDKELQKVLEQLEV